MSWKIVKCVGSLTLYIFICDIRQFFKEACNGVVERVEVALIPKETVNLLQEYMFFD